MSKSNEEIIREFLALWATRDADAMVALFAEDGVYDNVPQNRPMEGREAIREWLGACFEHLERIDVEVLHMATNGEWTLHERLDDHIFPDKNMLLPVMNACRIVNGEIVMFRDYYDMKYVEQFIEG